jgi:hypothetical protein
MNIIDILKKNAGTILTVISAASFVVTVIEVAKNTPKALQLIEDAKAEKHAELTKFEIVQVAAPAYKNAVIAGAITLGTMIGANVFDRTQQASLITGYAALNEAYKKHKDKFSLYRKKVTDIFGEEADLKVAEAVSEETHPIPVDIPADEKRVFSIKLEDDEVETTFESTLVDVIEAEAMLNRELVSSGCVSVNFFLKLLDIPLTDNGNLLGWNMWTVEEYNGIGWIDFDNLTEGDVIHIIPCMDATPGFEDYDDNTAYMEHRFLDILQ